MSIKIFLTLQITFHIYVKLCSRCAVRLALDIKHQVAENFLDANLRDR
jgi:hypothetical protein